MRLGVLSEQIRARVEAGLPVALFRLALHNRFSYPLTGLASALLAIGLALRPGRKGHLTVAVLESFVVSFILWGLMVVAKALVLSERLPPFVASWAPFVALASLAAMLWARRQGHLGRRGI
jgi:lipopolysaccharide export system permease protein